MTTEQKLTREEREYNKSIRAKLLIFEIAQGEALDAGDYDRASELEDLMQIYHEKIIIK